MYSRKQNEQEVPDWQDQPGFRYRGSKAHYHKQQLHCYKGNPLVEALPPIYKDEEIGPLLRFDPGYDEQCRQLAPELRLHLILNALRFVEPLSNHLALAQLLDGLLRSGYVGRNPFPRKAHLLNHRTRIKRLKENLSVLPIPHLTGREVSIIGLSGVGKSTALRSIFSLYDQIINHSRYHGQLFTMRQLVYLKLECPQDGSPAGLCKAFFKEVDRLLETNTYRLYVKNGRRTVDEMMIDMAEVASRHFLGLLAIDEIQNLRDAKGNWAAQVHNFLVQLDNELGIPVVLVGTPKAQSILTGEFRRARRASGLGAFPWDRMQEDEEWDVFTKALWKYQYVRKPIPFYGHLWEIKLHEWWLDPDTSIECMARRLGVDPITVKRQAKRLGLPPRCTLRKGAVKSQDKRRDLEQRRKEWLKLVEEHEGDGITDLIRRIKSANAIYSWLKKHDREWLFSHLPPKKMPQKTKAHIRTAFHSADENAGKSQGEDRDVIVSRAIRLAAQQIVNAPGEPRRVTPTQLEKAVPSAWLRRRPNVFPFTLQAFQEVQETREAFALRRIQWALEKCQEESLQPTRREFILRAKVRRVLDIPSVQVAIEEALTKLAKNGG